MKVAVVSGTFRPGFSYQENLWAERLHARGDDVRVFSTGMVFAGVDLPPDHPPIVSVPTRGLPRRNLWVPRGLAPVVRRFAPDLILWFGPPQLFGLDVARDRALSAVPLVAFMGQNRQMHPFDWRGRGVRAADRARALAYGAVRAPAIRVAMARARRVVATTPDTTDIVLGFARAAERARWRALIEPVPLGYDARVFGPPDEQVVFPGRINVIVSSRMAPEKIPVLTGALHGIERAMDADSTLHATWVGFDDGAESARFGRRLDGSRHRARMVQAPFADRATLAAHYRAADIALFARASISAQEALGCGCYGLLAAGGAMDWLLTGPDDGALFDARAPIALADALAAAAERIRAEGPGARRARAERAERFAWRRIIDRVLDGVVDAPTG